MKLSNTEVYTVRSSEDHGRQRTLLRERIFSSRFDYRIKVSNLTCWFPIRNHLTNCLLTRLIKEQ